MKLHLETNIAEGTPEELVEYLRLVEEEKNSGNELFSFGHAHQPDEDTLKSLVGSLVKVSDSYTYPKDLQVGDIVKVLDNESGAVGEATVTKVLENGSVELVGKSSKGTSATTWAKNVSNLEKIEAESTENDKDEEEEEVYNDVYDKGAFYTVTEEASESTLPVGAILQHLEGRLFEDSKDVRYIISNTSYVYREHVNGDAIKQDRFELAKQLGIQLTSTTDLAQATEGKYFKVTVGYPDLIVGDIVTIVKDDKDNQPQCKDKYGNFCYVYLHHLELLEDDEEEEEFDAGNYSIFSPEAQTPSTDIQVGDRVRVLKSEGGAEGEATVTAVLENGDVELDGISKDGTYLTNWSNHISNLENIEEDKPMGYTFWYIDGTRLRNHNVLKASLEGYFEDSTGKTYTYQAVSDLVKPIDNENAREAFERAKDKRALLSYHPVVDEFQISY